MVDNSLVPSAIIYFPTKAYCKKVCEAEPRCSYYFYGLTNYSCELYPYAQKSCTTVLGAVTTGACNTSRFQLYNYIITVTHIKLQENQFLNCQKKSAIKR